MKRFRRLIATALICAFTVASLGTVYAESVEDYPVLSSNFNPGGV